MDAFVGIGFVADAQVRAVVFEGVHRSFESEVQERLERVIGMLSGVAVKRKNQEICRRGTNSKSS